jgi:hypothetical protein
MKPILMIATVLAFALSACGAKATPTPDIQATAMAAASTMIAETQAAMPTDTPIPPTDAPTDTPQATPTIPPLPTTSVLATPTTAPVSGGDCTGPISVSKGEKMGTFLLVNQTKQVVTVSFQLKKNAFGDCGYWSTLLKANGSEMVTNLPINSCYNVYAFNQTGKPDWQNGYYNLCNGFNTDKFTVKFSVTTITVTPP